MRFAAKSCLRLVGLAFPAAPLLLGVLCASPRLTLAQQAQPAAANVSGTVVQEITEQGLRKVVVTLTGQDPEKHQDYTTSTDPLGQFRIEGVAPGEYEVTVVRL